MDGTTVLDFSSTAAGDGVAIHGTFDNKIRDLQVFGAHGNAIGIYGIADGESNNPIGIEVGNVRMTGVQTGVCLRIGGAITSSYHDLICVGSPTYSYATSTPTTSQHFYNVYSSGATLTGFFFNNTIYSDCTGCYSDSSGAFGYIFTNVSSFHCVPCSGEANPSGLYDVAASTAIGSGSSTPDIHGLVLQPFSYQNGTSGGAACTLLATSLNSKTVDVSLLGGSELNCTNSISFTMTGTGVVVNQYGGTYLGSTTPASGAIISNSSGLVPSRSTFSVTGVNFNSANTDNAINLSFPPGAKAFRVAIIMIGNASASISTATFGLFTSTGGGGVAIMPAGQAITVTTSAANTANNGMTTAPSNANTLFYNSTTVYFRVGTAQGSAATGDVTFGVDWVY